MVDVREYSQGGMKVGNRHYVPIEAYEALKARITALEAGLRWMIDDVQEWCDAVERDSSWDGWDHHYKSFAYGGLQKARNVLVPNAGLTVETSVSISSTGTIRRSVRDMVVPRSEAETEDVDTRLCGTDDEAEAMRRAHSKIKGDDK